METLVVTTFMTPLAVLAFTGAVTLVDTGDSENSAWKGP